MSSVIRVPTSELRDAFAAVNATIDRRSSTPVMSCIRLRTLADHRLELFGTSIAGQVTALVSMAVIKPGDIDVCVPADKLAPILGAAAPADGYVEFAILPNGRLGVERPGCTAKLPIVPGETLPVAAQDDTVIADFDIPGLGHLIGSVEFAANDKDIRPYCQGVWLESDGECVYAVATDVNTMAINQATIAVPLFGFMLMAKSAALLAAFDPERLIVSNESLIAVKGDARLHMKKALLKYPAWRRGLPELKNSITFRTHQLRDAISMHRFYDGQTGAVRFECDGDGYFVRVKDTDQDAQFFLDVVSQSGDESFQHVFKGEQIAQIVSRAGDDTVTFFWDAKAPRGFLVQNGTWRGLVSRITL